MSLATPKLFAATQGEAFFYESSFPTIAIPAPGNMKAVWNFNELIGPFGRAKGGWVGETALSSGDDDTHGISKHIERRWGEILSFASVASAFSSF